MQKVHQKGPFFLLPFVLFLVAFPFVSLVFFLGRKKNFSCHQRRWRKRDHHIQLLALPFLKRQWGQRSKKVIELARGGSGENPDGFPQNFFNFTWNNPSFRPATLFVILTPPRRRPLSCTINNIGQSLFSRAGDFFPEKAAEKKGKTNDLRRCDISLRSLLSVSSIFLVTPDRLLRRHTLPYLLATSEVTVSFSGVSIVRPIYYVHNLHFPLARFPTRSLDKKKK